MSTTNNTFCVAFYLKKQKTTQAGKSPIYARITVNGKRIEISVKRERICSLRLYFEEAYKDKFLI
ncbi:Arm DNA-binding domain-containing protein [Mucilaginibacter gracilis]|uniref:Arm DNA-binding domain-containing protein n=1 Tax=Mucilaginibacter gracilis TaxID=423350 RepID=UPI000EAD1444|nr:Arm DNA-binding domain-containing protein [Mucilaginibacter gracilis]